MVGSKEKLWECGLVGKSDGWVKGECAGVWSGGEKRWLGQRKRHRSVVWWEKAMFGSKGKLWECGLTRKNAAWVKGKGIGVWSGKGKPPSGSKGKASKCGLARENRRLGQRGSPRSVDWQGKTAAWVKEKALGVWSDKKNRRLGQRGSPRSVVWWEKALVGSKGKLWECGLVGKAMVGSKGKLWECGLTRKIAARVKRKALGVWSGKKKRRLGQRGSPRSVV